MQDENLYCRMASSQDLGIIVCPLDTDGDALVLLTMLALLVVAHPEENKKVRYHYITNAIIALSRQFLSHLAVLTDLLSLLCHLGSTLLLVLSISDFTLEMSAGGLSSSSKSSNSSFAP